MPLRSDWSAHACTVERGIDTIGDPWALLLLREAFAGARQFDEFATRTGISDKALSARLKDLVAKGIMERITTGEGVRPRAEYRLTEAGADTLPIIHAFALWAAKHAPNAERGALGINCRSCGAAAGSADTCLTCHKPLDTENVRWTRPGGWNGAEVYLQGADVTAPTS